MFKNARTPIAIYRKVRFPLSYGFFMLLFAISGCDVDVISPEIPQQLTVHEVTSDKVVLTWLESSDNVATMGYRVYRDGGVVGETSELQFVDEGLAAGTQYVYAVTAFDVSGNESAQSESVTIVTLAAEGGAPQELIGNALSGTSIGLSWLKGNEPYMLYRNGVSIGNVADGYYIDDNLSVNTEYTYSVTAGDIDDETVTSTVRVKTLINDSNLGVNNGAQTIIVNDRIANFDECNNERNALNVADEHLDGCLRAMLEFNGMTEHLEDMRAFAARVRREQSPAMVALGMRLFHSKSLSANKDTSCSSCHHPALGCGGDNLSMPIGVNAVNPALLGPGRSDGTNDVPIVPRNSPAICNTSLWTRGLFWDNRVEIRGRGLLTESTDVTTNTVEAVGDRATLTLLTAQAHFPVTAAPEMGDIRQFGYDDTDIAEHSAYRETVLAGNLDPIAWASMFSDAFGSNAINYSRIAEAIASYESVQLFIDNPFFDYVDGNSTALTGDEKRGAITFMASSTGCTFCHAGAFFTTEAPLPANYPQIGVGTDAGGSGADVGAVGLNGDGTFRAPSLLNVAITGPWGHNGQFATLKRNVEHYQGHGDSISKYFAESEMCSLEQFSHLADCSNTIAPNGLSLSEAILAGNEEFSNGISDAEVDLIVLFLGTLTDPDAANTNSNAIQALIPARDSGPDGNQLDAVDRLGNAL